ncbi:MULTISPECIES: helix-turn-helix domain-containing protein [Streptomyces]|uniref:helix-turn-helix domain-containing protein n=1 Tax=Streptomyces TaxID=1883 RepID=UPI00163BC61D|nr:MULTISPECIES: helix-turn-helix domain-containing protein [Streptomyces]MBC2874766.1 helix-turn-helix domain-containing protein [Streptomyces sp. TYQ1024]UBI37218.1 helix-turn-helix domain-containing protein [Streptomyces mobaraensis]UKW29811.1 helix-turn-helix domain-containing protein [Streptomyces sp. TYQ1024]
MPRWKELPASLDQRVSQFVVQLRRLKDRSGLSLAALAAKTSYSRSSWERYLNGRQLPPREAVEELARVCGADPARLLVLHEIAEEAWPSAASATSAASVTSVTSVTSATSAGSGTSPAPPALPDAAGLQETKRRLWLYIAAVAVLVVALAAALLAARPWKDDDAHPKADAPSAMDSPSPFVFVQGRSRPCPVERRGGELWAGYSPTRTVLMDLKSSGWEVLEAQCLLKHHGFDPGLTDGSFGPRSKAAAERFQKARGLVVDGIVGPDTWKELRR